MEKISAVINTYNEEKRIAQAIESLKGFDEIVVCDMESTDRTCDIARSMGARVITYPRGTYNICEVARDTAIHAATNPWVLVLDADELVTPALREYLYKHANGDNPAEALSVPFATLFMGQWSSIGERHVRFFRQDKAYWPPIIHSRVKIDGRTGTIPARKELMIKHVDDPTLTKRIDKLNRYSDNEVGKRLSRKYSALSLLMRPWLFFFKTLILKGSIRDGKRGIIRAYMEALYQVALLGKHLERTTAGHSTSPQNQQS